VACFRRSKRRSAPRRTTRVTGLDFSVKALFIVHAVQMLYSSYWASGSRRAVS
jgi:hypothetical protein